jgi:hypothetical protein
MRGVVGEEADFVTSAQQSMCELQARLTCSDDRDAFHEVRPFTYSISFGIAGVAISGPIAE